VIKIIFCIILLSFSTLQSKEGGEIHLTIQETENDTGVIQMLLFNNKEGFPGTPEKALKRMSIPIKNKKATIILKGIEPGMYAISVFHDEDEDGEMKKNGIGLPLDKYGFSNDPTLIFGPPSFKKSSFEVKNKPIQVEINLR